MQKEIWRDIKGYENHYQVSNHGNIISVKNGKKLTLKPWIDDKGYFRVHLSKSNKKTYKKIHKLVAEAFLNHKSSGMKLVVDHIDWNKLNNNVNNLQLITNRENASKDQFRHNRTSNFVGVSWDKHRRKWLSEIKIDNSKKHLGRFENETDAAKAYQNELNKINAV